MSDELPRLWRRGGCWKKQRARFRADRLNRLKIEKHLRWLATMRYDRLAVTASERQSRRDFAKNIDLYLVRRAQSAGDRWWYPSTMVNGEPIW